MPFYTVAFRWSEHAHSSWSGSNNGRDIRHLIITPDRSTVDQFFRLLQETKDWGSKAKVDSLIHHSPQMFTWCGDDNESLTWAIDYLNEGRASISSKQEAKNIQGKVHYKKLFQWNESYSPFPILPHLDLTDHIEGKTFCIRNKRVPERFWALDNRDNSPIVSSTTHRAKFRIQIKGRERKNELLMVNSDYIHIIPLPEENKRGVFFKESMDEEWLHYKGTPSQKLEMTLDDLLNGKIAVNVSYPGGEDKDPVYFLRVVDRDSESGEQWELC
ncbi:hypothetical protein N7517_007637 [Penicillium concentricum]|uniref:Uncharacterized protein n=1 Tax=Penicillium concentricum TaxID=293559 RepID=A0A9W9SBK9_9EURO|nr:uncharacterized protein N7517_007637 [Penicillium concentricum]KAJ5375631.1 hypothetical protein N7517_007637 [Penicillium concentricum]